ncbi:MAG: putative UDP-N-acetylmuramoylalanine--D-glutamate ligase [Microgenomates group bacterium Gr01-1014_7]|nr:MAG: putative UDP-N-acetylmuramoylalanine--D-glutamate ligase [Microgenomates group bacterium Gr01-1014_7]
MNFQSLRKKHKQFIYEGFEINEENGDLKISFNFTITPDVKFKPEIIFPNINWEDKLNNLVFNLGMIEMLSYWKATCSPEIIIKAGSLNEEQINWWKDLIIKGLGEFFYNNKIDFTIPDLVNITSEGEMYKKNTGKLKNRNLVLIGGGKDSAVTLERLKGIPLMLNPTNAAKKIAKDGIIIKRKIDPKLLELNAKGYLNGHTPFSAYLAFLSTLSAHLYGYQNVVVSNEASSNEGNVFYHGQIINHQYSKSKEFEQKFREYSKKYLSADTNYYSYLRKFSELEIARQFASMEQYHKVFRSCNRGSKLGGIWCGECSKCLFSYLILYPFLGKKLIRIFGKDLLNDETLSPIMEELLQFPGKFKPFECVGTKEEVEYAMLLGILKGPKKLLEKYKSKISVLILGTGREGQVTKEFLKKNNIKFAIADTTKKNYLGNYDVIIKSPGIPFLPEIKKAKMKSKIITSATQIFFDLCKGKIIGVTGTKGKSTTAAMIYEVLKTGGLDVYFVGNIGRPPLELLEKINENSVLVYELSSFQLTDLTKSPYIAVITNIYPDHLDWHGSFENYKKAKENITKYQTDTDVIIQHKNPVEAAKIIGKLFKIHTDKIKKAIKNFKPLPHRLEYVGEVKGIKFYNDSLATNPHATIYGLRILGEDVETLMAGGFDRGVDYAVLGPAVAKSKIKTLILFPDTGEKIWQAVKKANGPQEKLYANSMEEAVKLSFEKTNPGKICLMSPASASFNMFKDYEDRGNQFKKYVLQRN